MERKELHNLQIELQDDVAEGNYSNLAIISHSSSEFILDFVKILPGLKKTKVQTRVIRAPEHAKRLRYALQENITRYEKTFGEIRMSHPQREDDNETYIPPIGGFKGEA